MSDIEDLEQHKFVHTVQLSDDWEIETDSGWQPISHIHQTKLYQEYHITLENGMKLACADDHILFDHNMTEIFVKDLIVDKTYVMTDQGLSKVVSVFASDESSHMYDVTVNSLDHRFFTNGILSHNTTTAVAIILHYILFNEFKTVAVLANKGDAAREVLSRIQLAYEALPAWLQQGVVEWNKGSIELENGCKIYAGTTSSSAIRGKSISFLYLDEVAFIEGYSDFFSSVYPTISSGEETKLLMTSTPNGMNHFYKTCKGAEEQTNGYEFVKVMWYDVPGRNEAWKQETLEAIDFDEEKFQQEYCCQFLGSSGTLISSEKLKNMTWDKPLNESNNLLQYDKPIKDHMYALIADVSRGKGLDYSTFSVIDMSVIPNKQVCTFRDNLITSSDFASIIFRVATLYFNAQLLIEINDIGQQVADIIFFDYGYEELIYTANKGRSGKQVSGGFSGNVDRGIRTTKSVKTVGCSILKLMIEQDKLHIVDFNTIQELYAFSKKLNSYEAEAGSHDDMVMPLVLYAWLTAQTYFKDLTDTNMMEKLRERTEEDIEESLLPFGFVVSGSDEDDPYTNGNGFTHW